MIQLHDGAQDYREKEQEKLLIATGALDGLYYELGGKIKTAIDRCDIKATVVQGDGSIENAALLREAKR